MATLLAALFGMKRMSSAIKGTSGALPSRIFLRSTGISARPASPETLRRFWRLRRREAIQSLCQRQYLQRAQGLIFSEDESAGLVDQSDNIHNVRFGNRDDVVGLNPNIFFGAGRGHDALDAYRRYRKSARRVVRSGGSGTGPHSRRRVIFTVFPASILSRPRAKELQIKFFDPGVDGRRASAPSRARTRADCEAPSK